MPLPVTEEAMDRYLDAFHRTYLETVERFVPEEHRSRLLRYSLLPASVTGWVSANWGAGFEYGEPGPLEIVPTIRGSARIEDLFFMPPAELRVGSPAMVAMMVRDSRRMLCQSVTVKGATPFRLEGATDIILIDFRAESESWQREVRYAEIRTNNSEAYWSETAAVGRAKDEVFVAWLDLDAALRRRELFSDFLRESKAQLVLLLGDYDAAGRERLEAIRAAMPAGYRVLLVEEVDEPIELTPTHKVMVLASAARFVIVDNSSRGGQLAEIPIVTAAGLHIILLNREGSESSAMARGLSIGNPKVEEIAYTEATLAETVAGAVARVEARIADALPHHIKAWPWKADADTD